ncbi:hypothetical protein VNO77_16920 [Canavalia gladiata]|uniref:50S ribosomal protein 5, chloroplastic n=1 Tax=Canavalia gladiata TaxID=3824 RepID=A0AAN9QG39_CANGL
MTRRTTCLLRRRLHRRQNLRPVHWRVGNCGREVGKGVVVSASEALERSSNLDTLFREKEERCGSSRAAADDSCGVSSVEEGGSQPLPPSENEKEGVPVEKLPFESKLKEREEQKLRMKLAKKIRLRRKRLLPNRRLRKKGRWPPSKMKKLKNV